jgi:hypothetical protein
MKSKGNKSRKSVLRKTFPFLKIVSKLPLNSRKKILQQTNGDMDILKSLRELAVNAKLGNLKLNKKSLNKNSKYINDLIKTKPKNCCSTKRKALVQKGGFFLGAAIPILATLASTLFSK